MDKICLQIDDETDMHYKSPHPLMGDFTLCGCQCVEDDEACNIKVIVNGEPNHKITCENCIAIINACKNA